MKIEEDDDWIWDLRFEKRVPVWMCPSLFFLGEKRETTEEEGKRQDSRKALVGASVYIEDGGGSVRAV